MIIADQHFPAAALGADGCKQRGGFDLEAMPGLGGDIVGPLGVVDPVGRSEQQAADFQAWLTRFMGQDRAQCRA